MGNGASVLAIADDLTGALEVGAKFAGRGVKSRVLLRAGDASGCPVVVIDTESRHLAAEAAAAAVVAARRDVRVVYKKTDSTLRGNIAAELGALGGGRIAYVGAYPAMGRTVRGGRLYVDGMPVERSAFARDELDPVHESSINYMLEGLPCTVYDGETDADVERAVSEALADPACRVIAGPASVADALASLMDLPRGPVAAWPRVARCLVVNGSRHPASLRQIEWAREHCCDGGWRMFEAQGTAAAVGRAAVECIAAAPVDAVMVFGGDTAFGIIDALGCEALEPLGEAVTGVPVSRMVGRELILITKAGGFGGEKVVTEVREALNGNRR